MEDLTKRNKMEDPQRPKETSVSKDFHQRVTYNHKWLERHSLANRPWFILGSAPDPVIPQNLSKNVAYAYVKFAGYSAKQYSLPQGDITLATGWGKRRWTALRPKRVVRVLNKPKLRDRFVRLVRPPFSNELTLMSQERDDYVLLALGSRFRGVGSDFRPSSALTLIAFAIVHRIPEVIISGVSLDRTGHAYNELNSPRKHALEDRAALKSAAALYSHVKTTQPDLANATGLPLY